MKKCKKCCGKVMDVYRHKNFRNKFKNMMSSMVYISKKRGHLMDIDENYLLSIYEKQYGLCYYSGEKLLLEKGLKSVSVDRLDSSKGYVKGNIVLTTWEINNMKKEFSEIDFIDVCGKIWKNSKDKLNFFTTTPSHTTIENNGGD